MRVDLDPRETCPPGRWRVFVDHVSVPGERIRAEAIFAFVRGANAARKADLPFGLRLERDGDNPQDRLAVALVGFWTDPGTGSRAEAQLGPLPRELAFKIRARRGAGSDLAARLRSIETLASEDQAPEAAFADFVIDILQPA